MYIRYTCSEISNPITVIEGSQLKSNKKMI